MKRKSEWSCLESHAILIPEAQLSLTGICRLTEEAGCCHSDARVQPALLRLLGSWLQVPKSAEVGCHWCHRVWDVHMLYWSYFLVSEQAGFTDVLSIPQGSGPAESHAYCSTLLSLLWNA